MRSSRVVDKKKSGNARSGVAAAGVEIELRIAELAHGGDGVAIVEEKNERRAVFVSGAAPGDRLRAKVDFASRPARGRLVEILEAGEARVAAPCPHVERCGGCNWMHIARISQPSFHASIVRAALPETLRATPITSHPSPSGGRTRARLHVKADRRGLEIGFYESKSHTLVSVDACLALHPSLDVARGRLTALFESARGDAEVEIALGALVADDAVRKPVIDISWRGELPAIFFARMEEAVTRGEWQGGRVLNRDSKIPATIGDPTPWIRGGDDAPLKLAPGGFAQASEAGNSALSRRVDALAKSALEKSKGEANVVELYAGAGNFTVLLARHAARVIAVESNAAACSAAQENLRARSLTARVVNADASTYAIPDRTQLVVLDPPRTGAREACEKIVSARVRQVVYVSCDPATLGRDLAILDRGGYGIESLETFEMFPDTSHVETVVALARGGK
ncbi:MAG: methyltransferase domain-containing protein [Polyangiaceae bacterium]